MKKFKRSVLLIALLLSVLLLACFYPFGNAARAATSISITEPIGGDDKVAEGEDYAVRTFSDPWDMSNSEDVSGVVKEFTDYGFQDGKWVGTSVAPTGAYFFILWGGYPNAVSMGRDGILYKINTSKYKIFSLRMYSSQNTMATIHWFHKQDLSDPKAHYFSVQSGWHTYSINLAGDANWTGEPLSLRLDACNAGNVHIEIDWIRLVESDNAKTTYNIRWNDSSPGGFASIYYDTDNSGYDGELIASGIQSNASNSYNWGTSFLRPGIYYIYIRKNGENSAYSGPIKTNQTPLLQIDEPDAEGGEDYATAVLGDPWDMSNPADIWEHYNITDFTWDGGIFSATNYDEPSTPTGANDPSAYPRTPVSIDTSKYHRLTFRYTYDGSFDLVHGTHARFVWLLEQAPWEFQESGPVVTWDHGWHTYTSDLATCQKEPNTHYGWTGRAYRFRIDPHEDWDSRRFHLDYIKLAADDQAGSFFDIKWNHVDADNDNARVSVYWDDDSKGYDGHLIESDVKENIGSNTYRWLVGAMPSGTYYVYLKVEDDLNTNYAYSSGPVRVSSLNNSQSSFNELMGTRSDRLSTHYYFPWYDLATSGMQGNWILVANPSAVTSATVDIKIQGEVKDTKVLSPGAIWTPRFSSVIGGPVEIISDQLVIASQRVLYKGAFNEVMGTRQEDVGTRYYFTWYDWASPGMNGNWILVSNVSSSPANVTIRIAGQDKASGTISPGQSWAPSFQGLIGGPVEVISDQNVISSQRVVCKDSFNEVMGTRQEDLGTRYYFTWYDWASPGMHGNWVLIANPSGSTATAQVYVNDVLKGTYSIPPADRVTPYFLGTMGGPVKVVCTTGQNLIVSQRVVCKESFNELMGTREEDVGTRYYFTWYDWASPGMHGNWILVSNVSNSPANVTIRIAGQDKTSGTINPGQSWTPSFQGVIGGPVEVTSTNGQLVLTSQRVVCWGNY